MFARVRANAEKACFEAGDLFEIMQVIAMAERVAAVGLEDVLTRHAVQFPLRVLCDGDIEDAAGIAVLQVDPNCERDDDQVTEITDVVVAALNACAGFGPLPIAADIIPESTNATPAK
ncbi:hypothetical protein KCP91_08285 [Microvirga sp. SRT01]|uniref:Uncharacterized protein n=1 Tax=Sphingomonas longa TaxID=2778730 RepID=A0ABS2D624_9SPHN|nr:MULTISPECIES: hypothetical protein [Alphaproteobacteria]MBM6576369.1 hypothetical protein [Sphingomonas sp. BT552]MBR7709415.1 hypothetical protein [Microvirga sp. SRT01]